MDLPQFDDLGKYLLHLGTHRFQAAVDSGLLLRVQRIELLVGHGFAVRQGNRSYPFCGFGHVNVMATGQFFKPIGQFFFFGLELVIVLLDLLFKGVLGELMGQLDLQPSNQARHGLGKLCRLAGGHANSPGTKLVVEIVDHAPILRGRLLLRMPRNNILGNGTFPVSLLTGNKDVVAGLLHVQPEMDGANGALLPDHFIKRGDVSGALEAENSWIAYSPQLGR